MEDLKNKLKQLLEKSEWTNEERQWLLEYLDTNESHELRLLMLQRYNACEEALEQVDAELSKNILERIHLMMGFEKVTKKRSVVRMWNGGIVAASLIGLLILGSYIWWETGSKKQIDKTQKIIKQVISKPSKSDILPGGNKAVLTLADGSTILLEDAQNGLLSEQGKTKVLKLNGKIEYNASTLLTTEVLYNTISTSRGGQFHVVLPDRSQVWLNASSSIRFPTAFTGNERSVEITGEAYFEVVKKIAMPFIVKVNGAQVHVLGTHFNIMAYNNEASLNTTLLEGSVKFINGSTNSKLKPGQQLQLRKDGQVKVENGVYVAEVVAWKNGLFQFRSAEIEAVMMQLSRWYDVDVVYKNKINDRFYAEIPRNTKLSDVLQALELTGKVRFEIKGKKIIVGQ